MINMLIVEDNILQSKNLLNYICEEMPDIRVSHISTTGEEALKIINMQRIDIILLDLRLPGISGIDIIEYIVKNKLQQYKNSIIIVTGEIELLKQIVKNPYIFAYNIKGSGIESIIENIKRCIKEKIDENEIILVKKRVRKELEFLKFNFSHKGSKYLEEVITELYIHGSQFMGNLNKNIYPIVACKNHTSVNNIKCNITQAVIYMYYNCDANRLKNYFEYNIILKPKVKEIIYIILNKL